ncbi:MAG: bifunctional phosphopantothenoylcysteine decarboxylase/phosphopantothenate--cysteine ligase CoaBC [Pseudomonadota bacterium]
MNAIKKRILLGVCGGIAAYKAAELVRLLRKRGSEVRVVMTQSAQQFITPLTLQALSGHAVHSELFDLAQEQSMSHIHLARWAEQIIIAPCSANTLAKMAHGLADDLLSTLVLAAECPIAIAPAMNQAMWQQAATQNNLSQLQAWGVKIIGPEAGEQACGEQGPGRMSEPQTICDALLHNPERLYLKGRRFVISAGPTREPLDPVRFISNRSSGKMGYALAEAAADAGADVTLISGPVNLASPDYVNRIDIETAQEMYEAVLKAVVNAEIYIGAAAVADYRPVKRELRKIKKQADDETTISLCKNPDIIANVAKLANKPFVVGFAAETDDLKAYALGKLSAKNLDMIAANWVGGHEGGFDKDLNALDVYWPEGHAHLPMTDKRTLASQLLRLIAEKLHEKDSTKNS